ncbi:MAG: alpha/beta fold hydrolase [Bacteroidota bacterium]
MPSLISSYQSPKIYFHGHVQTIAPALLRKVKGIEYERERITTPDDDFLDLDWVKNDSNQLVIICHGLEGNTYRPYIKGMARVFGQNSFSVLTWNYRGCSEEMNKKERFYHSGATDDLHTVINHAVSFNRYAQIHLVGFSLGGNLILKYLGEQKVALAREIKTAVTFSVPLDLHQSCLHISKRSNLLYAKRFLKNLKHKIRSKASVMPEVFDLSKLNDVDNLFDFDNYFTAPLHGFDGALNYYHSCSAIRFVEHITIPTLIVNAKNDPFLPEACYPEALMTDLEYVFFEAPRHGGHCGFPSLNKQQYYWSESRALAFVQEHMRK